MTTVPPMDDDARLARTAARLAQVPAEVWDPPAPPPLDLDRALAARPETRRRLRLSLPAVQLRPIAVAGLAVLVLALGLVAGLTLAPGGGPSAVAEVRVPLRPLPGSGTAGSRAVVDLPERAGGVASMAVAGLPRTRSGDFYEVWLMTDDTHLVSLGTFRVGANGRANVRMPVGVDPYAYRYLDVSLEPDDGNPAHSANSVLRSAALT